jgi:antitoxin component of MazEF toxin-antitoxin module
MLKKVIKTGNSLAVVIPSSFVKSLSIKKGDTAKIDIDKSENQMTIRFSGVSQLSLTAVSNGKK